MSSSHIATCLAFCEHVALIQQYRCRTYPTGPSSHDCACTSPPPPVSSPTYVYSHPIFCSAASRSVRAGAVGGDRPTLAANVLGARASGGLAWFSLFACLCSDEGGERRSVRNASVFGGTRSRGGRRALACCRLSRFAIRTNAHGLIGVHVSSYWRHLRTSKIICNRKSLC